MHSGCAALERYGVIRQITHMPSMMLAARLNMRAFCIFVSPFAASASG